MTKQSHIRDVHLSHIRVILLPDAECEIPHEAVGCYGEVSYPKRALPDELVNEVKPFSKAFNGVIMEFGDTWKEGFKKFLCRCARKAVLKGYTLFGVHEHGELRRLGKLQKSALNNNVDET